MRSSVLFALGRCGGQTKATDASKAAPEETACDGFEDGRTGSLRDYGVFLGTLIRLRDSHPTFFPSSSIDRAGIPVPWLMSFWNPRRLG